MSRWIGWWRHAALAGGVVGLLISAHLSAPAGWLPCTVVTSVAVAVTGREVLGAEGGPSSRAVAMFLLPLAGVGALIGLGLGSARVAAIDSGALPGRPGEVVEVTGFVEAVPRRSHGEVRVQVRGGAGRVVVVAPEPVADLPVGSEVEVRGTLSEPDDFRAAELERIGAEFELHTRRIVPTGTARGGLTGVLDRIRLRAERALGGGLDPAQAALARGFVLGQDDRIDPVTREEFRRSGLSHLLAVSGQNVMLLAVLAGVVLALFGLRLRSRLMLTIVVIAIYVPVAGGGPSIQRAGVMGAAAIVATFAGRPTDRAYPPLLAAAATLAVNPRFGGDVGWQLSFAAVIGIIFWAGPLRELIGERLAREGSRAAQPRPERRDRDHPCGHGRNRSVDRP